jgi:hypothetical protein
LFHNDLAQHLRKKESLKGITICDLLTRSAFVVWQKRFATSVSDVCEFRRQLQWTLFV